MPPPAAPVTLTAAERKTLDERAAGPRPAPGPAAGAGRAGRRDSGHPNARIAADLRISQDMARKWRGRFAACGLAGLARPSAVRAAAADHRG